MDEGRLVLRVGDRFQKAVHDSGIRRRGVEREVYEGDAGGLGGRRFGVDVGAGFARLAQVDDGRVAHLFESGDRLRRRRPRARDGRLQPGEVRHAGQRFLRDVLRPGNTGACPDDERNNERISFEHDGCYGRSSLP